MQLTQRAHKLAASGKKTESRLRKVEEEIDRVAAQLWGITEELVEVLKALDDLG